MVDNNFTYLDDILDLDEPGNENENENENFQNKPYSHYSEPPKNMSTTHDFNSIRGAMSTQEMFNSKPQNIQEHAPAYTPRNDIHSFGKYTPISKVEEYGHSNHYNFDHHHMNNHYQEPLPKYSESNLGSDKLTDRKIQELTTKYDELCYICKKLNDKERVRYHYIYNVVIVFLFIIILLLVKKVLNI